MTRTPIIAGNWKMNFRRRDISRYAEAMTAAGPPASSADIVLFPSPVHLALTGRTMPEWVAVGAQDVHARDRGAFTGDVAAGQAVDSGASWTLVGHSERRQYHAESNDDVARKARSALRSGLMPVVCVGETLEQRQGGQTEDILDSQVDAVIDVLTAADGDGPGAVLAYEPVWAIGTGLSASPDVAAAVHSHLRKGLNDHQAGLGETARILYGGSVNAGNCRDLASRPDIDGFLIGGASLDPASFLRIIRLSAGAAPGSAH